MQSHRSYFTYRAYTLIELLLAVLLLVIILCTTVPGWQLLLQNNTAKAHVNRIVAAMEYTRTLAIKQNKNIALCRLGFRDQTNSKDWSSGQVIVDQQQTSSGKVLYSFSAVQNFDKLFWSSSFNKNDCIVFTPLGEPDGQQGSFYYCHGQKHGNLQSVEVVLQETGSIYTDVLDKCPDL